MFRRFSLPAKLALGTFLLLSVFIASVAFADDHEETRTYRVTVINLTDGQYFTPPVVAAHDRGFHIFRHGREASFEVKEIAENGNIGPLVDFLDGNESVSDFGVAVASEEFPPLAPREQVSFEVTVDSDDQAVSLVSMLICTNDGITGADHLVLPDSLGSSRVRRMNAFDAGTEINTEDFADIVPPCPALTGFETDDEGTGASNPELFEGRNIRLHRGIQGVNDLDPAVHGWIGPVGVVVVTRVE